MALLDELQKGLRDAGTANFAVSGSDAAMDNIAVPIANAITKGGEGLSWQGTVSIDALNAMPTPVLGGVYRVEGNGTLSKGGLVITWGDVVVYNGTKFEYLIDLDGGKSYVTTAELDEKLKLYAKKSDVDDFVTDDQLEYVLSDYAKNSDLRAISDRLYSVEYGVRTNAAAITALDEKIDSMAKNHLDMKVDSDVVEFFMMEA